MIAQALRLWQVTPPLALWRIGFTLVLLVQLIVLRETSEGRFWLLSQGGEAVQGLWYLHTATKVTLVSALALLVCALVERRFDQPAVLSRHWIWRVCLLHIGALVALMSLIQTLPVGSQDLPPAQGELWRYPTTSIVFLLWQGTAVLLIAPRLLIRGMRFHTSAFVLCAMTAAVILSTGSSAVIDVLRSVVEDTTLSLSLVFYAWIGEAQPVLSLRDGAPLLAAPGFAISIGAPCAGYQGMLASAIIMAGLIALEWPNLRHGRALILGATTVAGVFALNALRIALLFHIGVSYSPQMAVEGFHSYFGTLSLLLVVGMAMLAMQHRSIRKAGYVAKHLEHLPPPNHDTNWDVEAGKLMLPIALYLSLGMLLGLFIAEFNWSYPLLVVAGFYLMFLWREEIACEFSNKQGVAGFAMGVAVYLLWLMIVPIDPELDATFAVELKSIPLSLMLGWITFRLVGFSIVVPVLEELAFRGGLMRLIGGRLSQSIGDRTSAWIALVLSSLAFGAMHVDFLAGILAGASFGLLVMRSGRIGDAIIAHSVTNFLLALTAMMTGHWSLW